MTSTDVFDIIIKCLIIKYLIIIRRGDFNLESTLLEKAIKTMIQSDRMHRQLIEERGRSTGLHRTAHMILVSLARTDRILSQRELAERFSISPAAITGILKNLERDGYVSRAHDSADNRSNVVSITDSGRELVAALKQSFREVDAGMFLGFTDGELCEYIAMHERIQKNMLNFINEGES